MMHEEGMIRFRNVAQCVVNKERAFSNAAYNLQSCALPVLMGRCPLTLWKTKNT